MFAKLNKYTKLRTICLMCGFVKKNLQDTFILNNMLAKNLLLGEPRNAITFNTDVLMVGLKVKSFTIL